MTQQLQTLIDNAWDNRASLSPAAAPKEIVDAVDHVISELNNGTLRVATREAVGQWTVHQWIKKAVLLSFRLKDNELIEAGDLGFYDKVPTKFGGLSADEMSATGVRVVPPAVARRGSFIAKGAILMPSYVNIGAYVDEGTMVDTWATVGSCAQVGKNVHLSGGFGGLSRCGNIAAIGIADSAQHLTGGHFHRFSALRSGLPLPVEKLAVPKGLII